MHSLDFVEAIKQARLVQPDKDALVIFAGACQSYYELLVASGANFCFKSIRKNIHALDPVIITSQIASTNIKEYVDLEKVMKKPLINNWVLVVLIPEGLQEIYIRGDSNENKSICKSKFSVRCC